MSRTAAFTELCTRYNFFFQLDTLLSTNRPGIIFLYYFQSLTKLKKISTDVAYMFVHKPYNRKFQVLMAASMKMRAFWDNAPCSYS
jgi:hypothetical protein